MKKTLLGMTLLAGAVLLTACQSQSSSKVEPEKSSTAQTSSSSTASTKASSSQKKVDNEEVYASVLDLYRPVVVNKTMPDVTGLDNETALSLNMIYDAVVNNQSIQYSFVDINKDGQDELLIGSAENIYAIFHLHDNQPTIIKAAGVAGRGGDRALLKVYEGGTIYYTTFQAMRPEARAETYKLENGQLKQEQVVDYSMADTRDATGLVGLADAKEMDLSQVEWKSFAQQESQASSDQSNKQQAGMDINGVSQGDFSSVVGTWTDGKGNSITFNAQGITNPSAYQVMNYSPTIEGGYLQTGISFGRAGASIAFIPKGVTLPTSTSAGDYPDASDTSKERIWIGQSPSGQANANEFYYRAD